MFYLLILATKKMFYSLYFSNFLIISFFESFRMPFAEISVMRDTFKLRHSNVNENRHFLLKYSRSVTPNNLKLYLLKSFANFIYALRQLSIISKVSWSFGKKIGLHGGEVSINDTIETNVRINAAACECIFLSTLHLCRSLQENARLYSGCRLIIQNKIMTRIIR